MMLIWVVPASAGVILTGRILMVSKKSRSRVSGGDPGVTARGQINALSFPRERG